MAVVAQWQSTDGHNQLSWVQFLAIASFMFLNPLDDVRLIITFGLIITSINYSYILSQYITYITCTYYDSSYRITGLDLPTQWIMK